MKRWLIVIILGVFIRAGAIQAQVYTDFDGFNAVSSKWYYHDHYPKTEFSNGLLRFSWNSAQWDEGYQWINMTMYAYQIPGYFSDYGVECNGNDIFTVMGVARAPHRITDPALAYRVGLGFLDIDEFHVGITVDDSSTTRRIVARYRGNIVKSVPMSSNTTKVWLRVRYKAALRRLIYWWAPYYADQSPNWIKLATYTVPESDFTAGKMVLNPAVIGLIKGQTCPSSWNVGLAWFSYSYANQ
jgi:hypothetical protein